MTRDSVMRPTARNVWLEHGDGLKQFIFRRVRNRSDAEDITQDVMMKVHRNLHGLGDIAKVKGWLYAVARNTIVDYYRKPVTEQLSWDPVDDSSSLASVPESLVGCIEPLLRDVAEPYREALRQVELLGTSQAGLAQRLGLSHSAIKSRVQRGRRMLRSEFDKCCRVEDDGTGHLAPVRLRASCC